MATKIRTASTKLSERPLFFAAAGALCIASSGVLVRLADTTPVTVAFYRCFYALPFLGAIALYEKNRFGPLPSKARRLSWAAGIFFAADLIFWHHAIDAVGAGLATVLGNLQVLVVGIAAWMLLGERLYKSFLIALPLVLGGVVLISGVIGQDAYGEDPALGVIFGVATSLAYAAFILLLRQGSNDLRRVAGPLFHATLVSAGAALVYGTIFGGLDLNPGWPSHGWLIALALTSQVIGWLLISWSLPRLPAAVTSIVLLLQPVGAMLLASIVLDERPGPTQLLGAVLILAGVVTATSGRARAGQRAIPEPVTEPLL